MLQQTRVDTVIPYYRRFLEAFPDAIRLCSADLQSVYKLWEGLGYYSRARHLHRAARILTDENNGRLPRDPDALRRLPGIGDYIAAAVLSIAFDRAFAVVDGNVKRVLSRLFRLEIPVNQSGSHGDFQTFADFLLDEYDPGRHNQAVMELGALVCTPRAPACSRCPLASLCRAFREDATDLYPRRLKRSALPLQHWAAGVVPKNGRVLMIRRPEPGLLAGLWEFPCMAVQNGEDPCQTVVHAVGSITGIRSGTPSRIAGVRHTYTHFKLCLDVYLCPFRGGRVRLSGPSAFQWVLFDRIRDLPLHKAVHKALPAVEKILAVSP